MKAIYPDGAGSAFVGESPAPELFANAALCRMTHGLISAGTERGIVTAYNGKTREECVAAGARLGYTGAGVVEQVSGDAAGAKPGDRVAYYGAPYVTHSEFVAVPRHLVHRIPDGLPAEHAAFIGLGAIAMHGFRLGRVALGEVCWVVGAGIIGNLCAQMALLAGARVVVSDPATDRLERLKGCVPDGADLTCVAPDQAMAAVAEITGGRGADTVLLCLATKSAEPMEQAVSSVRAGGRIVVVGVLDIHVPREAFFLRECEITISRAGGPGRYNPDYERGGVDLPPQFARWTEGRNCGEALRLIAAGRLRVESLVGHRYRLDEIADAYAAVTEGRSDLGHLIVWPG